jgi:3-hydroxyisobutyrate dehydrogenase-like beta-hydroxyacid dehydrogenase
MSRRTQRNVGIIGLGIIGSRVAQNVRSRGFHAFVWNRTPRPFPNFVGSPAEIAELCDYIQIFVSDDEALLEMVQAMKQSLKAHHVVMAHSTVAPHTMRAAAEIVQRRGAQLLDAPFTGSKGAAERGELVYYIGGDDAAYRRVRPILEASSKEIIEIGDIGQATTIKIATNMVTAATVQSAAEALALVHHSGLPLEKFAAAMQGNGSNSGTLAMKLPKMLEADFEPHFSVDNMLKDVTIASRLARAYGFPLPATEAARDTLIAETRQGRGDYDYSSMVAAFFPDGMPGEARSEAYAAEEQATLSGLDRDNAESERPIEREEVSPAPDEAPLQETAAESEPPIAEAEPPPDQQPVVAEESRQQVEPEATSERIEPGAESMNGEAQSEPEAIAAPEAEAPPAAAVEVAAAEPEKREEPEEPRGFLARLFGKGDDY